MAHTCIVHVTCVKLRARDWVAEIGFGIVVEDKPSELSWMYILCMSMLYKVWGVTYTIMYICKFNSEYCCMQWHNIIHAWNFARCCESCTCLDTPSKFGNVKAIEVPSLQKWYTCRLKISLSSRNSPYPTQWHWLRDMDIKKYGHIIVLQVRVIN